MIMYRRWLKVLSAFVLVLGALAFLEITQAQGQRILPPPKSGQQIPLPFIPGVGPVRPYMPPAPVISAIQNNGNQSGVIGISGKQFFGSQNIGIGGNTGNSGSNLGLGGGLGGLGGGLGGLGGGLGGLGGGLGGLGGGLGGLGGGLGGLGGGLGGLGGGLGGALGVGGLGGLGGGKIGLVGNGNVGQ